MAINGTLRFGMRSAAVFTLQQQLKKLGHFDGPVTGYYGPITRGAVTSFESAKGLRRDGVADATMRRALAAAAAAPQLLRPGMRSADVKALQQQLRTLGFFRTTPTGYYGPITQRAVRAFEAKHQLRVDGNAGQAVQELAAKLARKAASAPTPTPASPSWKTVAAPPSDYRRVRYDGATMNVRTREMLQRAERYARAMGAPGRFTVTQGSYNTSVSASAGTHDGGGALDIRISGYSTTTADKMVKALRMAGFAAWRRGVGDGFAPHIHAIAIGDRQASSIAKSQVREYFQGGDGLVGSRRDIHLGSVGHNVGRPVPDWARRFA
ncbi:MAG: peptidoglycan-binding protein [Myxococcota bacterium]